VEKTKGGRLKNRAAVEHAGQCLSCVAKKTKRARLKRGTLVIVGPAKKHNLSGEKINGRPSRKTDFSSQKPPAIDIRCRVGDSQSDILPRTLVVDGQEIETRLGGGPHPIGKQIVHSEEEGGNSLRRGVKTRGTEVVTGLGN